MPSLQKTLQAGIGLVWFINGLFCKVLNLVPRHEEIVWRITGFDCSRLLTVLIGLGEIGIAACVFFGWQKKRLAILQIAVIAAMNTLEFFLVPDLLLWGRWNAVFAAMFIGLIYYTEAFVLHQKQPGC